MSTSNVPRGWITERNPAYDHINPFFVARREKRKAEQLAAWQEVLQHYKPRRVLKQNQLAPETALQVDLMLNRIGHECAMKVIRQRPAKPEPMLHPSEL